MPRARCTVMQCSSNVSLELDIVRMIIWNVSRTVDYFRSLIGILMALSSLVIWKANMRSSDILNFGIFSTTPGLGLFVCLNIRIIKPFKEAQNARSITSCMFQPSYEENLFLQLF